MVLIEYSKRYSRIRNKEKLGTEQLVSSPELPLDMLLADTDQRNWWGSGLESISWHQNCSFHVGRSPKLWQEGSMGDGDDSVELVG